MRRVSWWVCVTALVAVAVPIAARLTGFEAGFLALLVGFMPWVTLACAVPLGLALLARSRVLVAVALVLSAVCVWFQVPLFTGGGDGATVLTVASVNMTLGGADADAVVALVRDHQVDVLSVQELSPQALGALADAGLDAELPFHAAFAEPGVPGTGLWSRYPIAGERDLPGFTAHAIRASVEAPSGAVTVFAVHPQAPGKHNHRNWAADLNLLTDALAAETGPVYVAGDFNTTRDHAAFRGIEGLGYGDAANQAGSGFAPTFPENRELWPLVAIDHVLTRDTGTTALRTQTVNIPKSDHRALVVAYGTAP